MDRQTALIQQLQYWNRVVNSQPQEPKAYIQRGMVHFKLANIAESIQDFDNAEKLEPTVKPYLWQRGLSYYYAQQFQAGADQFEVDLQVNSQDVEETVWRYLCLAQLKGVQEAKRTLLPVRHDPRRVMRQVYELFAGNCTPEVVLMIGESEGNRGNFYSHLYVGLYWEAKGQEEQSKDFILKAVSQYPLDDYMWHLGVVHQTLRGWT